MTNQGRNYLTKPVDKHDDVLYNVFVSREKASQAATFAANEMTRDELRTIAVEALEKKYYENKELFVSHYEGYKRSKDVSNIKGTG